MAATNPTKIERSEGHFFAESVGRHEPSAKRAELFYQSWTTPQARATLIITHGISEHSEAYSKTADHLARLGWNVVAWDLRGHGRSEGKRGFIREFRDFSLDLADLLAVLKQEGKLEKPFALVGHSMGGLITLRHLVDTDASSPAPAALALSSPLLGVALAVPAAKDFAARILNRVLPAITLYNEIRYQDLTRDIEHLKTYPTDALRHDKISPGLYLGMFENIAYVQAHADRIKIPTLVQAAGKEKIVSLPAIREFFSTIGASNKQLQVYEESYHEIYNDLDRKQVFDDLNAFLSSAMGLQVGR